MSTSSPLTPDSGSDLSDLSDVDAVELEKKLFANKPKAGLDAWLQGGDGASSPPSKRKREASPAHDYILADNQDIAFIVMFRARFASAFPRFVTNFGPQDLENAVVGAPPEDLAEKLLCALLALVCNRKKDIAVGAYNKALEEAISENRHQWPRTWLKNPMSGGTTFNSMAPEQKLDFLKTLCLWALNASEAIQAIIKDSYKQNRHDDDLNQPLSVQPWGRDSDKRRYWLIEGQDDTYFRLYRESNPALKTSTWWSVASTIEEISAFSAKLAEDGTQASKRLSDRINSAVPRFIAGEDKRKRREYRLNRKAQFSRPDPGFSLYEGRTRGKRQKYTFSDDEDGTSDAYSGRRSTRNATPAEPAGPVITASGRQVRSRLGGTYGETLHSGQNGGTASPNPDNDGDEADTQTRAGRVSGGRAKRGDYVSDDESDAVSSGNEWEGNADEEDADDESDDDVEMGDEDEEEDSENAGEPKSLVVKLQMGRPKPTERTNQVNGNGSARQPERPTEPPKQVTGPVKSEQDLPTQHSITSPTASKFTTIPVGSPRPSQGTNLLPAISNGVHSAPSVSATHAPASNPSHKAASAAPYRQEAAQSSVSAHASTAEPPQQHNGAVVNGEVKHVQNTAHEVTMSG